MGISRRSSSGRAIAVAHAQGEKTQEGPDKQVGLSAEIKHGQRRQSQSASQADAKAWAQITGGTVMGGDGEGIEILIPRVQGNTQRPADVIDGGLDIGVARHFRERPHYLIEAEREERALQSVQVLLARNQLSLADLVSAKEMWDLILRLKRRNQQNQCGSEDKCNNGKSPVGTRPGG